MPPRDGHILASLSDAMVASPGRLADADAWRAEIDAFEADGDAAVLKSVLPDAGFKLLDDSGDSLSTASRAYLEALIGDLESVTNAPRPGDAQGPGAGSETSGIGKAQQALTVSCFILASDCQLTGVLGIIQGRWRAFTCENRALFGCRAPFPIALVI